MLFAHATRRNGPTESLLARMLEIAAPRFSQRTPSPSATRLAIPFAALLALALAPRADAGPLAKVPNAASTEASLGLQDDDLEELLAEFRDDLDLSRRRGDWSGVEAELTELLNEDEGDWASRSIWARLSLDRGEHAEALKQARRSYRDAGRAGAAGQERQLQAHLVELEVLTELGRHAEATDAIAALDSAGFPAGSDSRADQACGDLWLEAGERELAFERFEAGSRAAATRWDQHLAMGRCLRRLGDLEAASNALVKSAGGRKPEPEALAELADLYFEADGEVSRAPAARNPGPLFKKARSTNPKNESALLGLYELYRFNWKRQSFQADEFLEELLSARPTSVDALLADAGTALDFGQLRGARQRLVQLLELAPGRREVRTLEAALAYLDNRKDRTTSVVEKLTAADPEDSAPERRIGKHLVELYRFSEALSFLNSAVERNPEDYLAWTELGRARANTGDLEGALEAFGRAEKTAAGRSNAVRENLKRVLERIDQRFIEDREGALTFAWQPEGSEVLATYLVPFYEAARAELVDRYGYSTGDVRIEVFERHGDFSVRSTGFEGFPALGVCFGPVVTAVSPLAELRGSFSWARTGFHEFTHVVHLGLSHNRCPRWITEGLATWEEQRKSPAWQRNMRQDLLDARANGQIFPLRELNRAFRGPRVLFGYYQGGLLCSMLIEDFGFPPMVAFLEAFDRGLDLDQAVEEVFQTTPEEIDVRFAEFVDAFLEGIQLEPRWSPEVTAVSRLTLDRSAPRDPSERKRWGDRWLSVAFGDLQSGSRVDAEDVLRRLERDLGDEAPSRIHLLRGRLALDRTQPSTAAAHFEKFLEAGGEDFQVRLFLADRAFEEGDSNEAEAHLILAEGAFPGFPLVNQSAELGLARMYEEQGRGAEAMAARERWCDFNAANMDVRLQVARWHQSEGRHEQAEQRFREANEVDPFLGRLHLDWARSLLALDRPSEALREYTVALAVPGQFDLDPGALESSEGRSGVLRQASELALNLGRPEAALDFVEDALELGNSGEDWRSLERRARAALEPQEPEDSEQAPSEPESSTGGDR